MITKARKWIMVASLMLTIMAQLSRQKFDVFIMN